MLDQERHFLGMRPGATSVWLDTGRVGLSPFCPLTEARVSATRRGTALRAAWDDCGRLVGRSKLVATMARRDCSRVRGRFLTRQLKFVTQRGERPGPERLRAERAPFGDRVPTDPRSPWPKFRRDAAQTGRSPVRPSTTGGAPWAFPTGKGIFSMPVIGPDGRIYVGSADRTFYALERDGTVAWTVQTGEIIDSAALLDDAGVVYFGSGDGTLYARRAGSGAEVWAFDADPPAATGAFIDWFEANVAMGPDRTLYVPNDNSLTYAIDPETRAVRWRFQTADQTWSLPAVDPERGLLFMGNNNLLALLGPNTFAIDAASGETRWSHATDGTIAASPMLTPDGLVVVGGFDGWVRAYDADTGRPVSLDYGYGTERTTNPDGTVAQVRVPYGTWAVPATLRLYLMVDGYPAARATATRP